MSLVVSITPWKTAAEFYFLPKPKSKERTEHQRPFFGLLIGRHGAGCETMGRNAMTRTQTPFDNFFLSSPASLCTSKTVFLL